MNIMIGKFFPFALFLSLLIQPAIAQKIISEGTIVYDISIQTNNKEPQMADALDGATSTLYLKGGNSRVDMVSALGSEKTIYDGKTGAAVILKEYSGQKLMITLTADNWDARNKKYAEINYTVSEETKSIIGYTCQKATAVLKDSTVVTVYFTKDLTVANKNYDQTFKSLPGFPMQYEFYNGKTRITYTVSKIDWATIAASRFDFPKSGYRVMSFDETKAAKRQ
jgi:GLPGLI family protein